MKTLLTLTILISFSLISTSCMVASLITAPVKIAGDVAEGAYNVGKGVGKGIHHIATDSDNDNEEN